MVAGRFPEELYEGHDSARARPQSSCSFARVIAVVGQGQTDEDERASGSAP
jgi:hypothetical protein